MDASKSNISMLQKLTLFISGFIVNLFTITIFLKALSSIWGIILGLAVSVGCSIYILKKNKNPSWHIVAKGIITSAVVFTLLSLIFWAMLQSAFEEIAG
jgi:xanthine/uracil permease